MKRYIIAIIGVFCLVSCEDFLEREPISEISDDNFWQNNNDLAAGVGATYDALQIALRTNHWYWGEARSDNFGPTTTPNADNTAILNNTLSLISPSAEWADLYRVISFANLVIANAPDIPNADQSLLGEAHALRALAYFYAIRIWGDVPLFEEPVVSAVDADVPLERPRTSVDLIMSEVIMPDLDRAEELVSLQNGHIRFTMGAVRALRAHVQMWNEDFGDAITTIEEIEGMGYALIAQREEWANMFVAEGEVGNELIFSLQWELEQDGNGQAQSLLNDGSPAFTYSRTLLNKWLDVYPMDSTNWVQRYPTDNMRGFYGDWRRDESLNVFEVNVDSADFINNDRVTLKYLKQIGDDENRENDDADYPIFRYAGILLLKAEAYARNGDIDEAIATANQVLAARDLPPLVIDDASGRLRSTFIFTDIVDVVLEERQFELYAEGHRWFDLRRNASPVDKVAEVMGPINGLNDPGFYVWPVSQVAMQRNRELLQNDAYLQ